MARVSAPAARFAAWLGVAALVLLTVYFHVFTAFFQLLNGGLESNFGTVFPAIPLVALLGLLFFLRWGDLREVLAKEGGLRTEPRTRLAGLAITALPLSFASLSVNSLPLSAATVVLVFYGTSLLVNPKAFRIMLPYAVLYLSGVTAPFALEYYFGEPFAGLASAISERLTDLAGLPVSWQGNQFELVSRLGGSVTGTVTPGCSSILSVTTFLGLLGLMYFDMRRDVGFTLKLAVAGTAALVLLNSARILILIWAGYAGGAAELWSLHNWIGYAIFVGFYMAVLFVYSKGGHPVVRTEPSPQSFKPAIGG